MNKVILFFICMIFMSIAESAEYSTVVYPTGIGVCTFGFSYHQLRSHISRNGIESDAAKWCCECIRGDRSGPDGRNLRSR